MARTNNTPTTMPRTPQEELVDMIKVVIHGVQKLHPSRANSLAKTKLEEAILWLGGDVKDIPADRVT